MTLSVRSLVSEKRMYVEMKEWKLIWISKFSFINFISFRTTCLGKIRSSTLLACCYIYWRKSRLDSSERYKIERKNEIFSLPSKLIVGKSTCVHVYFFGQTAERSWIQTTRLLPFIGTEKLGKQRNKWRRKVTKNKFIKRK